MRSKEPLSKTLEPIIDGLRTHGKVISQWIEDKPGLPIISALITAMSSDLYFKMYKDLHGCYAKDEVSDYMKSNQWLDLYTNKNSLYLKLLDQVIEHIKYDKPLLRLIADLFGPFQHIVRNKDTSFFKNRLMSFFSLDQKKADGIINFIKTAEIQNLILYYENLSEEDCLKNKWSISKEMFFAIRISHPCELIYAETPFALFRKSQDGDCDAICKLLKIDKTILRDHKIAKAITSYSLDIDSDEFRKITRAMGATLKVPSFKKMKSTIAAYIFGLFNSPNHNLTAPDLQKIFDFAYQVKNNTDSPDFNLSTPEGFAKSIQRNASKYSQLVKVDKK